MKRFAISTAAAAIAVTGIAMTAPAANAAAPARVKSYTAVQVAQHASSSNCWTIIGTSVYNLTAYVNQHPGGSSRITAICGRNGTSAFKGEHGSSGSVKATLSQFRIGKVRR